MRTSLASAAAALCAAASVHAHSSPKTPQEIEKHNALQQSFYHCAPAVAAYTEQRKRSWAQKMLGADAVADKNLFVEGAFDDQEGKDVKLLSCEAVENTSMKNSTCVLSPVVTQGPYYHTTGHKIRQNMAEWQNGLLFLMDIGVMDVETCEPLPNALVDVWHANATGFYSGHPKPRPHLTSERPQRGGKRSGLLSAYPRDSEFDWETWLRAAWPTDRNGVAQFTTIFPGFYTGRATHVHLKVHTEWAPAGDGGFETSSLVYTGQLFFADEINIEVDKMWPYSQNPLFGKDMPPYQHNHFSLAEGRTRNEKDSLQIFPDMHGNGQNPVFDMHPLNGVLSNGLVGYATLGVDRRVGRREEAWDANK